MQCDGSMGWIDLVVADTSRLRRRRPLGSPLSSPLGRVTLLLLLLLLPLIRESCETNCVTKKLQQILILSHKNIHKWNE